MRVHASAISYPASSADRPTLAALGCLRSKSNGKPAKATYRPVDRRPARGLVSQQSLVAHGHAMGTRQPPALSTQTPAKLSS
jgi:hypothetical protein